jgi:hypothetical protein
VIRAQRHTIRGPVVAADTEGNEMRCFHERQALGSQDALIVTITDNIEIPAERVSQFDITVASSAVVTRRRAPRQVPESARGVTNRLTAPRLACGGLRRVGAVSPAYSTIALASDSWTWSRRACGLSTWTYGPGLRIHGSSSAVPRTVMVSSVVPSRRGLNWCVGCSRREDRYAAVSGPPGSSRSGAHGVHERYAPAASRHRTWGFAVGLPCYLPPVHNQDPDLNTKAANRCHVGI